MAASFGARRGSIAPSQAAWERRCRVAEAVRGAAMNSKERHAARRARRDAKRAANKAKRCAALAISKVAEIDNIYEAASDAAKGVR